MDFSYTEEQQMLQDSVRKFVLQQYDFDTRNKIIDSEAGYSKENWKLFAELGWLTVPFREKDGGFGDSAVDLMVVMEEFGRANLVEPFLPTVVLAGRLLAALADDSLRQDLLPKLMTGQLQLALAYAESQGRYNLAHVATTAKANGEGFLLSGSKVAVLNGANADKLLVVARESGNTADSKGISVFLLDPASEGVQLRGYTNIDGNKSAFLALDNARAEARIGAPGEALAALQSVIDRATVATAAEGVGAIDVLLDKTVEYSKTRKQFDVPIGSFQALQHRMANMFIECQQARSIVLMAAMELDSEADATAKAQAVSAAKSRVGRAMRHVGQEAIQIHGGIGMTEELDVGHLFKRITALEILFGDADFHANRYASLLSK
ncbi:MAG: acyl-CoA dehydrogenase [Gammaproteobacteria bacterium]